MRKEHLRFESEFRIVFGKGKCQFAEMTLKPGETEGGPDNRHKGADQWLFVISGHGVAVVSGTSHKLSKWTLLLIERGENHEIRNTGRTALRTLNAYAPLAYTKSGNALPAGKPS